MGKDGDDNNSVCLEVHSLLCEMSLKFSDDTTHSSKRCRHHDLVVSCGMAAHQSPFRQSYFGQFVSGFDFWSCLTGSVIFVFLILSKIFRAKLSIEAVQVFTPPVLSKRKVTSVPQRRKLKSS